MGTDEADGKNKRLQFCGLGTKYDMRNARDDQDLNDLDKACKKHDFAYKNKDPATRNAADVVLENAAQQFLKKPGISLLDKIDSRIVTKAMKLIKRKV